LNLFTLKGIILLLQSCHFQIKEFETLDIKPSTIKKWFNKKQKKQSNSVAQFVNSKSTSQLKRLFFFRKLTNILLYSLGWGEDIYVYCIKPEG